MKQLSMFEGEKNKKGVKNNNNIPKIETETYYSTWIIATEKRHIYSESHSCLACGRKCVERSGAFINEVKNGSGRSIKDIHLLCESCRKQVREQEEETYEEWCRRQVASREVVQELASPKVASLKDRVEAQSEGESSFESQGQRENSSDLEETISQAERLASGARKESTEKAYASDLRDFRAWCRSNDFTWLPATQLAVALYVSDRKDELSFSTLERRLAAISVVHKEEGYQNPARKDKGKLEKIWKGLAQEKGRSQDGAPPLFSRDLKKTIENLPRYQIGDDGPMGRLTLQSLRDRALLLVGWAGALRRSELVSLRTQDVEFRDEEGMTIHVQQSKNDQEGEGLIKGIPYRSTLKSCPVKALQKWLQAAENRLVGSFEGGIFRRFYRGESIAEDTITGQSVNDILRKHLEKAGLQAEKYSPHSLRAGFITEAIREGVPERRVKEHSGHDSWEAFNTYVKRAKIFQNNPVEKTGL
jgi:site-specific recombinase XerD